MDIPSSVVNGGTSICLIYVDKRIFTLLFNAGTSGSLE